MVSPIAEFVVDMGSDGRIISQGTLSNALAHDAKLLKELKQEQDEIEKASDEVDHDKPNDEDSKQAAGKLVVEEETELGHVQWTACESIALFSTRNYDVDEGCAYSVAVPRELRKEAAPVLDHVHWSLRHPPFHRECSSEHSVFHFSASSSDRFSDCDSIDVALVPRLLGCSVRGSSARGGQCCPVST